MCSLCSRGATETCLVQLPFVFRCLISWRPGIEVTSFKAHHNHKVVFYSHYCPFETGWQFSITLFTTSPASNPTDLISAAPPLRLHLYIIPTACCCFTSQSSSAESRSSLLILGCFGWGDGWQQDTQGPFPTLPHISSLWPGLELSKGVILCSWSCLAKDLCQWHRVLWEQGLQKAQKDKLLALRAS